MVNKTDQGILYGHYNNIEIGNESEQYKLKTTVHCAGLNGLSTNTGVTFLTIDQHNDENEEVNISALGQVGNYNNLYFVFNNIEYFLLLCGLFSILNSDFHRMFFGEDIKSCQMLIRPCQPCKLTFAQ